MFGRDEDDQPPTDGEQFDAVGRFDEPEEPTADADNLAEEAIGDPTPTSEGVHPRVTLHFWLLVGVFKVALLGVSLGAILALLGDYETLGTQIFLAGLVLFAYGLYRLRHAKAEVAEIVGDGDSGDRDASSGDAVDSQE